MLARKLVHTWVQRCAYAVRAFSNIRHVDDIVGIDFGTSTSRLAIMDAEVPTLLETESGQAIPSFVAIDDEKKILVGQVANYHAIGYPADSFFNIKTLLGRKFHDSQIQELKTKVPYKINEGSNGEAWVEACNEQFSPTKLCAFIIDKMKRLAESYLGRSISKAVIAAPIYFNDAQKKELELAGKLAGLDVLGIVDEPVAAALASKNIDGGIFAVFSLGGGTFNISILEISDGVIEVKAKEFDSSLRGEDFDLVLAEYMVEEIRKAYSVDVSGDRVAMGRLKEAAEKAKLELSSSCETLIDLPYLTGSEYGLVHVNITLSVSKFEELVEFLIERIRKLCQKCLEAAHVDEQGIDEVILVGGMARVCQIQHIVEEIFMKSPCMQVNPEEAVAIGALLQGALIIEDRRKLSCQLIPLSLGIETLGGGFARIIDRHSVIPCMASRNITTPLDYPDSLSIRILQGEHQIASRNDLLGELKVTGIPHAPCGVVSIKLDFCVDKKGFLTVLAKSKDTDFEWSMEMNYLDKLSEDYVRMMAKKAILSGKMNVEKNALMQLKSVVEFKINRIEKMLNFWKKQIPRVYLRKYELDLAGIKKAMDLEDMLFLKSMLAEVEQLEGCLITLDPAYLIPDYLIPDDSDDERY
ncbi:hypothetical protein CsSME_00051758 [Camellia sinensis var. sinensis]